MDNADNLDANGGAGYHGYWGRDFFRVDEHFGTLEDFKELTALMHSPEYNMKLVLDYAPNIRMATMKMNMARCIVMGSSLPITTAMLQQAPTGITTTAV